MSARYDQDILAWSQEQARLLRAGRFDLLDLEHLADEIEDVGKSEKRELSSRMAVLLAHLFKWQFQPERRGRSWSATIEVQREQIALVLQETPSLKNSLTDDLWNRKTWNDARAIVAKELAEQPQLIAQFPKQCPWPLADVLDEHWLPEARSTACD